MSSMIVREPWRDLRNWQRAMDRFMDSGLVRPDVFDVPNLALDMYETDTDVVVKSLIKQPGGQPVAVDYGMEKTERGWKVYNVKIEGISLVENYRNTFNSEVQRNGVDGLIRSLAEKNKMLAQVTQQ